MARRRLALLRNIIRSHSQSFPVVLSHSQPFSVCAPSVYHADSEILRGYETERTLSLSTTLCYLPNIGDVRNDNYQYMAIVCLEKCLHLCNVKNRCLTINIFTISARRLCANKLCCYEKICTLFTTNVSTPQRRGGTTDRDPHSADTARGDCRQQAPAA